WSLAAPVCGRAAACKNLLDHLSESDDDAAQDRYIPRLVAGRGSQRSATVEEVDRATPPLIGWRRRWTSLQLDFADLRGIHPWAPSRALAPSDLLQRAQPCFRGSPTGGS